MNKVDLVQIIIQQLEDKLQVAHASTQRAIDAVTDEETVPSVRLYFEIARYRFGRDVPGFVTTEMAKARRWLSQYRTPSERGQAAE